MKLEGRKPEEQDEPQGDLRLWDQLRGRVGRPFLDQLRNHLENWSWVRLQGRLGDRMWSQLWSQLPGEG